MEPFKLAPTPVTLPEYFAFKEFTPKNPEQGVRYFHSVIKPWRPFSSPGTFGGFCLSQGALCAAYTCPKGFVVHNQHSYFLLPGRWDVPFLWRVESVRDGRSYCTREVKAYQPDLGFEFPESPYQQPSDFDFTDPASKNGSPTQPIPPSSYPTKTPCSTKRSYDRIFRQKRAWRS